jgi:hypothetical protein
VVNPFSLPIELDFGTIFERLSVSRFDDCNPLLKGGSTSPKAHFTETVLVAGGRRLLLRRRPKAFSPLYIQRVKKALTISRQAPL